MEMSIQHRDLSLPFGNQRTYRLPRNEKPTLADVTLVKRGVCGTVNWC